MLVIIGVITGMSMSSGTMMIGSARESATREKLKAIDKALLAYRSAYNRLPCPADLTIAEGATNFGVEGATPGTCTGGTPAANNTAAGVTNTGKTGVEGALPVVTLGLPNDFMYDGWGRRFRYAVDKSATAAGAFTSIKTACTNLAITVNNSSGSSRTTGALYAVISHGANGHGGYTKKGVITNASSTNTDEQTNCHCNASAAASTYAPTYVQKDPTNNSSTATDAFDDIVSYGERWQLMASYEKPEQTCGSESIYVVDADNHRIQKFDLSGTFLMGIGAGYNGVTGSIGSSGSASGQFNIPTAIAIDTSGNIYVVDTGNFRVQKFDSSGNFLLGIGSGYQGAGGSIGSSGTGNGQFDFYSGDAPFGVAIDTDGNVLVNDYRWRTQKFSSSGAYITTLAAYGYAPGAGLLATSTNIYTHHPSNNCQTWKRDLSGNELTSTPAGCTSTDGYFGIPSYVAVWAANFMAFDSSGNIWMVDEFNFRVQKFDTNLNYISKLSGLPNDGSYLSVTGVAFDSSGYLYLSNGYTNLVYKMTTAGTAVNSFAGGTVNYFGGTGSANGQFNYPMNVTISSYR
ncbi:MAG: hypothetical protein KIT17_01030 [Rubrivivax sp.]|nr:hypothetical protein [Rubrivivax sp.]